MGRYRQGREHQPVAVIGHSLPDVRIGPGNGLPGPIFFIAPRLEAACGQT